MSEEHQPTAPFREAAPGGFVEIQQSDAEHASECQRYLGIADWHLEGIADEGVADEQRLNEANKENIAEKMFAGSRKQTESKRPKSKPKAAPEAKDAPKPKPAEKLPGPFSDGSRLEVHLETGWV